MAPDGTTKESGTAPLRLGRDLGEREEAVVLGPGPLLPLTLIRSDSLCTRMTRNMWASRPSPIKFTESP